MTYQASRDPLALGEVVEMAAADRGERGGSAELGDGVRGAAAAGDRGDTRAFGSGGDVGAVIVGAPPSGREHRRVDKPGRFTRTRVVGRDGMVARESPLEVRRPLSTLRREDVLRALGAGAAAIATTAWAFTQVLPLDGPVAFVVVAYLLFLGFYVALISFDEGRVTIADRLVGVVIHSGALVLLAALVVVIVFTVIRGSQALRHANFWVEDLSITGPQEPLTMGGMAHAAVGTLIMIAFALAISIPLGLACAVFLAEFPGAFARTVRTVVEAMTALPSIVCGLFIYATYVLMFGFDKSAFAASLAITIMILPIIVRSADVVLRLVPATLKEASAALGASHWSTVWNVVLPTSRSGLMTAIILGTARGIGETSPVLLTAGYTTFFNANPFSGPMVSLPFATFTLVKSPEPNQIARGFGAAAVLMVMVFLLFLLARLMGGKGAGILSPRGLARARAASARDAARFRRKHRAARGGGGRGGVGPARGGRAGGGARADAMRAGMWPVRDGATGPGGAGAGVGSPGDGAMRAGGARLRQSRRRPVNNRPKTAAAGEGEARTS